MTTAVDKGESGPDNDYGYGVLNGYETILSISQPQHEVGIIDLDVNNYFILNENNRLKVKLKNYGLNDETGVEVIFKVDEAEIERMSSDLSYKF